MIDGVLSDLEPRRFETFDQLRRYCYQVASVVGLTTIYIFGFDTPTALPLAEKCGVAFQLTNILRDIREDADRGRVYLPEEDLRRFGVSEEDLRTGQRNAAFLGLMRHETERARAYYEESRPLLDLIHARSRRSLWAMIAIYSRTARSHREQRFRRILTPREALVSGEVLDRGPRAGYVRKRAPRQARVPNATSLDIRLNWRGSCAGLGGASGWRSSRLGRTCGSTDSA